MRDTATQRNASALPNWEATSFGAVADFINGYAFKPSDWSKFGLPIIRIAQMLNADTATDHYEGELPNAYRIDDGDLLFSWSATLATEMWTRGPAWLNQHLFKVVPKAGNSARFLHHLIDFHIESLAAQSHGTTMRHIKRGDLLSYPVLRPNPTEQSRIAAMLDTMDDEIAKTETVIVKLRQVRAGLLHDLLTRGLDENGELRDPIAHSEQFQDSPLGRIPREWEVSTVEQLELRIIDGDRGSHYPNESQLLQQGFCIFLNNKNIVDGSIDFSTGQFISEERDALLGKGKLNLGDIVITTRGTVGNIALFSETHPYQHVRINSGMIILRAYENSFVPQFFLALWRFLFPSEYQRLSSGSAQPQFPIRDIQKFRLLVPKRLEQQRIVSASSSVESALVQEQRTLDKLSRLKSGLMSDLLTGRVRVPENLDLAEVRG